MFAAPTVVGEILYIGSCAGICYALDKRTGDTIWKHHLGETAFHGDPLVTDSLLIIPTDGPTGGIYAFSLTTGAVRWQFEIPQVEDSRVGVTADLVAHDRFVIGVTIDDRLICLDRENGTLLWEHEGTQTPKSTYWNVAPLAFDSSLYFIGYDARVTCLNPDDGGVRWTSEVGARPTTSMVRFNETILVGCADSTVTRLSCRDGSTLGRVKLDGRPGLQLGVMDTLLYIFIQADPEFAGMMNLICATHDLSELIWEFPATYDVPWSIKKAYGYRYRVIVGQSSGEVLLLDPPSGRVTHSFVVDGEVRSVGFDEDVVYVGTIKGIIHAIRVLP